jgi:hypothetical protein
VRQGSQGQAQVIRQAKAPKVRYIYITYIYIRSKYISDARAACRIALCVVCCCRMGGKTYGQKKYSARDCGAAGVVSCALCCSMLPCQNAGGPSFFLFLRDYVRACSTFVKAQNSAGLLPAPSPLLFLTSERCALWYRLSGSSVLVLAKARSRVPLTQSSCTQKLGSGLGGSGGSPAASRSTKDQGLGAKDHALGGAFQMGVAYPLIEGRLHWASVRIEVTEPGFFFYQQFFMLPSPKTR